MTSARCGTWCPLLGALVLLVWCGEGRSQGDAVRPESVLPSQAFLERAEAEGLNLVLVRMGAETQREGIPRQYLAKDLAGLASKWQSRVEDIGGVQWITSTYRGWDHPLSPEGGQGREGRQIRDTLRDASERIGRALLATLTREQGDFLLTPWQADDILARYEDHQELNAAGYLTGGGILMGDKMTDYQRRMCGVAVASSWSEDRPLAFFLNAEEAAIGDFYVTPAMGRVWAPEVKVRNYKDAELYASGRRHGALGGWLLIDVTLPGVLVHGRELEELLARCREQVGGPPPEDPPFLRPRCQHVTDGPTSDVASLISEEEANLVVYPPPDIFHSKADLLKMLASAGYQFNIPPAIASQGVWGPDPDRPDGGLDFYTILNSMMEPYYPTDRLWEREGNTFTLVYGWQVSGNYALDPTPWLSEEAAAKPVTLKVKEATLAEFLATLREQTGAPLYPSEAASDSPGRLTARLDTVPLRDVLANLGPALEGAWERTSEGRALLIPDWYLEKWRRILTPDELRERIATISRIVFSLLAERLTPDQVQKATTDRLRAAELDEVGSELLLALAQCVFHLPSLEGQVVALSGMWKGEDGLWRATVSVDSETGEVVELRPPTIPPNPLKRSSFYIRGGESVPIGEYVEHRPGAPED